VPVPGNHTITVTLWKSY